MLLSPCHSNNVLENLRRSDSFNKCESMLSIGLLNIEYTVRIGIIETPLASYSLIRF